MIKQLRLLELDTVLIITSNYHSRRTHLIYKALAGGYPHFLLYPAPYDGYDPDAWWTSRKGKKIFVLEFTKYLESWLEVVWKDHKKQLEVAAQTIQIIPDIGFQNRNSETDVP
jgi:uncharacterized SAM-binding protein YcdF (DUF218 family)